MQGVGALKEALGALGVVLAMIAAPAAAYNEVMGGPLTTNASLERHLAKGYEKCGVEPGAFQVGWSHHTRTKYSDEERAELEAKVEAELKRHSNDLGQNVITPQLRDHVHWQISSSTTVTLSFANAQSQPPEVSAKPAPKYGMLHLGCMVVHFGERGFGLITRGCSTCPYTNWLREQNVPKPPVLARKSASAIVTYDHLMHEKAVAKARYSIVIYSGAGIPGSPGANQYFRKPREVLQGVVDTCGLGSTVYQQATDGVSVLHILDADLAQSKVDCVKSAEEPGLSLSDRGAWEFKQSDADRMAKNCGFSTDWARVLKNRAVNLQPPANMELTPEIIEGFGCFMERLRDADIEIGFIGNDRFDEPKEK